MQTALTILLLIGLLWSLSIHVYAWNNLALRESIRGRYYLLLIGGLFQSVLWFVTCPWVLIALKKDYTFNLTNFSGISQLWRRK